MISNYNQLSNIELLKEYHKSKIFDDDSKIVSSNKELRNYLAVKNTGLILSVIKKDFNWMTEYKEDLIQEGYFGLFQAIDKFDPYYGCQFSTYAIPWIHQACGKYIKENIDHIKVPAHIRTVQNKLFQWMKENNIALKDLSETDSLKKLKITKNMFQSIISSIKSKSVCSLDNPSLESESVETFLDEEVDQKNLIQIMKNIFLALPKREKLILLLRFNIIQNVEEIGL